jgi:hypothetical protein
MQCGNKNLRIVGVCAVCDAFAEYVWFTLNALSAACDIMCIITDRITRSEVHSAINACANLASTKEYRVDPYAHDPKNPNWITERYHYANKFNPDWILAPDHDDILPYEHIHKIIGEIHDTDRKGIMVPSMDCWGTPYTVIDPNVYYGYPHQRVYRGGDNNFLESDYGYCLGQGYRTLCYQCEYPARHLRYMTDILRTRRRQSGIPIGSIALSAMQTGIDPPTFPWWPDLTLTQWRKCAAVYRS